MKKLKGVIPPMITPFTKDGALDEKGLVSLVEYLAPRVDGLFICGSYGGGPLMNVDERKRVAEIVREVTKGFDVDIIVHTGAATTRDAIELSIHARDIGCDAASAVGPYYFEYADTDLISHFSAILEHLDGFPFYAYQNPKFQGYEISLNAMRALKEKGLSGIKDATFDIMKYAVYARELMDENFDIVLGTEAMWVSAHALGCQSFIPGIGNVFPELCKDMWTASMEGNKEKALSKQFLINRLRDIMYLTRSTQLAIYAIADIRGIVTSYPRAPFVPATDIEKHNIQEALQKLGV